MSSNLFSNQYPYTDAHELNLDWVIAETQSAVKTVLSVEGMANNALDIAKEAKTTADAAKVTADSALNASQGAVSIAQTATRTANMAYSTASDAKSAADEAKSTADTAKTTADEAKVTADSALNASQGAVSIAQTATRTANMAYSTASDAKSAADEAKSTADTAKTTADEAKTAAQTAQSGVNQILTGNYARYTTFSFNGGDETGVFTTSGAITTGSVIVIVGVYDRTQNNALGGYAGIPLMADGALKSMLPFGTVPNNSFGITIKVQGTSGIKVSGTTTDYTYCVDILDLTALTLL